MLRLARLPLDILFLTVDVTRTLAWDVHQQVLRRLRIPVGDHDPLHRENDFLSNGAPGCARASKYGSLRVFRLLCPFAQRTAAGEVSCAFQATDPQDTYWPSWPRKAALALGLTAFWLAIAGGAMALSRGPSVDRQPDELDPRRTQVATAPRAERGESQPHAPRPTPSPRPQSQQPDIVKRSVASPKDGRAAGGQTSSTPHGESPGETGMQDAKARVKAQRFVESGDGYFKKERYMEALIEYKNATRGDPTNAAAWLGLGRSYLRLERNPREALYALEKAVQIDPTLADGYRDLATIALAQRDAKRAVLHARKLRELRPTDREAATILSSCLYAAGDRDAAVAEMAVATELPTATADTFASAGELHLRRNAPEEAEASCRRALELDPKHTNARVYLACSLRRQGKLNEARQELDVALKDDAESTSVVIELAELLVAEREVDAAITTLEELTRREPKLYDSRARLAELLIASRRTADGVAVAKHVLKERPRHVASHLVLSRTFLAKRLDNMALDHCEKALAVDSRNAKARTLKGRICLAKKQYEEARHQFEIALQTAPRDFTARMLLGQAHRALGQLDQAKACFRTVAEQYPKSPRPHLQLGDIEVLRKLPEAAILCYEEALKRAPNSPIAANNIASLLLECDRDVDRAYQLASDTRKRFPWHGMVSDTYGWACYKKGAYEKAVEALSFATTRLPRQPSVRYHYGMALYRAGNLGKAKEELGAALRLSKEFEGAAEAKEALAEMGK